MYYSESGESKPEAFPFFWKKSLSGTRDFDQRLVLLGTEGRLASRCSRYETDNQGAVILWLRGGGHRRLGIRDCTVAS